MGLTTTNNSVSNRQAQSTKHSNKIKLKPIFGQQMDLKMKSKAEINGMRIEYIKHKDSVYHQYLVQQQITQKEEAINSLLKMAGV